MAIIANPTYDEVFKYLMADERVSRVIIGCLLDKKIKRVKQRNNDVLRAGYSDLHLLRLDFNAEVVQDSGETVEVCIELQRAQEADEVMRFRKYLATQYADETNKDEAGKPLHIVTIYLLGHTISTEHKEAVLRINHVVRKNDGMEISTKSSIDFISALTNDMIVVQIPYVKAKHDTLLDKILSVFKEAPRRTSAKTFDYHDNPDEQDVEMVNLLRVLEKAAADPKLIRLMDMEDELERFVKAKEGEAEEARKQIAAAKEMITEAGEKIAKADEMIAQADEKSARADEKSARADEKIAKAEEKSARADEKSAKAEEKSARADEIIAQAEEKIAKAEEKSARADEKIAKAEEMIASARAIEAEHERVSAEHEKMMAEHEKMIAEMAQLKALMKKHGLGE